MAVYKNKTSQKIAVFAVDSTGAPKTGDAANITAQISKDGGGCGATNDVNPTELDATNAKGIYLFDMTQAETNANLIVISPVSATSGVTLRPAIIYTEPELRTADVTTWNGTTIPGVDTAGYPKVTIKSGAGAGEITLSGGHAEADAVLWGGAALPTMATVNDIWDEVLAGHVGAGSAGKIISDNLNAPVGGVPTAILAADLSGASGRTVKQALQVLRNRWNIAAGTLTVYDTDDTTPTWTAAVTTTAGNPVTQINPA